MSEQTSNPKHECKCDGGKKIKALEKQVAHLQEMLLTLAKEVASLRKAVRK
jgi:hypothetical protein